MDRLPISVLLVEDDDDDYLLAQTLFAELPPGMYRLDRVARYEDAIKALDVCQHDLYLIDYRLGGHNGLELVREAIARGCTAPLIMLTGQNEREIDLEAMAAGAADYLIKDGLDAMTLERSMRYALEQQRHALAIRQARDELEMRVQQRTADLARANESLRKEIGERKKAEEALREADRRKNEFLAMLAHELRNPLAAMSNALNLLEMGAEMPDLRQLIRRQTEQLVRLIDDLLDVSRISRGKLTLHRERIQLRDTLESAIDVARPSIDAGQHRLHVSLPPESLILEGDKVRVAQVVSNLLVNAARYTPPQGDIWLTAQQGGLQAVITVRDNGVGIPPDMLPRIFNLFTQADNSPTRAQQGLGIGLTLAKTLVEMHGGQIRAESAGVGRGSQFTIHLPLSRESRPVAEQSSGPSPPLTAATNPLPPYRVLIVDDNESAAYLLGRLLQKLGQQVHTVHSAAAALDVLPTIRPEVVISDIAMPEMSGYELARAIRQREDVPRPVLVALTGYGQDADRQEALAAGFDRHLTKPAGVPALQELLSSLQNASNAAVRA